MKYIVKSNTWFKQGTEVKLIDDYRPQLEAGLFEGIRVCKNPASEGSSKVIGEEYLDQEVCFFEEFIIE